MNQTGKTTRVPVVVRTQNWELEAEAVALSPVLTHAERGPCSRPLFLSSYRMKEVDWLLYKCPFYKYPVIAFYRFSQSPSFSVYACED